jgi:hypothetical protein
MHGLAFVLVIILSAFASKIARHVWNILLALLIVEFLAQYAASLNLWLKIDVLTVYLLVWQLCTLLFSWIQCKLLSPIVIIEQGSFCLIAALLAWILHYVFLRYIALRFVLIAFWLYAILDM